jgi:hypothetical protein
MEIMIPTCSSNHQISKDVYAFLYKQGNHIPIDLQKSKSISGGGMMYDTFSSFMNNLFTPPSPNTPPLETPLETEKSTEISNSLFLEFQNKKHTIDNIKGTKLYYLFLRNGECARWI